MARSDAASALSAETLSTAGQRDQSHFVAWRCGARLSPERVVMLVAALDAAEAALVAASFPAWQRQFGFGPAQLGVINSCQTFAAAGAVGRNPGRLGCFLRETHDVYWACSFYLARSTAATRVCKSADAHAHTDACTQATLRTRTYMHGALIHTRTRSGQHARPVSMTCADSHTCMDTFNTVLQLCCLPRANRSGSRLFICRFRFSFTPARIISLLVAMLPAWGFLLPWLGFRRSLLIAVSTWALTTLLSTIDLDAIAGLASGFSITTAYFSDAPVATA
eukprot:6208236-Pleurochrysis_carterae.AAC.1